MFLLSPDELATAAASRIRSQVRRIRIIAAVVVPVVVLLVGVSTSLPAAIAVAFVGAFYYCLIFWRLSPRRAGRAAVRRQLADNPFLTGSFTVDVEPAGVRVQTATSSAAFAWAHFPYRAQADGLILLLTGPGRGATGQPLPLRAVAEAHRPHLLGLLAGHTQLIS
ncbi:hypothetical protein FraEuI1c_6864 [Pseudofrankia inefficax]|uniref:YcxB-like protein domain-containing protein n=2 Tax=Pseudofrankia inefficax (strain DSM 45817 / CECT 9037 / DDB 130130 / EuI1c) TaxID=298654 RepID=E3IUL7_PSEI1|nr:hypothetical protein FraEuI1c_6864 [Pseudofrankia inefficax]